MNRIVHFEIHAKDMDKLQKFYSDIFGWTMQDTGPEMGNYRLITTGIQKPGDKTSGINGGMTERAGQLPLPEDGVNSFVCTIDVEDIYDYVNKVLNAGGTVAQDVVDMPTVGKLAYCRDPEGNLFGMLQPV